MQSVQEGLDRNRMAGQASQPAIGKISENNAVTHSNGNQIRGTSADSPGTSAISGGAREQNPKVRNATSSQVRAIESIGNRLRLNLENWLIEKYGVRGPSELSIGDAAAAIDELNSSLQPNGANQPQ